jgi:hypothetical protein
MVALRRVSEAAYASPAEMLVLVLREAAFVRRPEKRLLPELCLV